MAPEIEGPLDPLPDPHRERVRRAVGAHLCNSSNFPGPMQVHVLGRDMGQLIDGVTDAVLAETSPAAVLKRLADDWRLIRGHHPVGAYWEVGQLDGDCSCGEGPWPCAVVRAAAGVPS